jgi:hypothetical protein
MRKKAFINRLLIVTMVCACFVFAVALQANADADLPSDGHQDKQLKEAKVTLQKKSSKMVSTFSGDRYGVDHTTMVLNQEGQQIQLEYMLVPCEAQLLYETTADGGHLVHRIKVLSVHNRATNRMEDPPR